MMRYFFKPTSRKFISRNFGLYSTSNRFFLKNASFTRKFSTGHELAPDSPREPVLYEDERLAPFKDVQGNLDLKKIVNSINNKQIGELYTRFHALEDERERLLAKNRQLEAIEMNWDVYRAILPDGNKVVDRIQKKIEKLKRPELSAEEKKALKVKLEAFDSKLKQLEQSGADKKTLKRYRSVQQYASLDLLSADERSKTYLTFAPLLGIQLKLASLLKNPEEEKSFADLQVSIDRNIGILQKNLDFSRQVMLNIYNINMNDELAKDPALSLAIENEILNDEWDEETAPLTQPKPNIELERQALADLFGPDHPLVAQYNGDQSIFLPKSD